jgi:hypothetical protein
MELSHDGKILLVKKLSNSIKRHIFRFPSGSSDLTFAQGVEMLRRKRISGKRCSVTASRQGRRKKATIRGERLRSKVPVSIRRLRHSI